MIKYGISWVDFGNDTLFGEQGGVRPALIYTNTKALVHSPVLIVIPFTTVDKAPWLPTHVTITGCGLKQTSYLTCETIRTVSRDRFCGHIGEATKYKRHIDIAVKKALGMED